METMNEFRWTMDDLLEKAKKNPMPIFHDFDIRFRVWTNQILKNRLQAIIQSAGNPEYVERMRNLLIDDYDRLSERCRTEFISNKDMEQYHERNDKLFTITMENLKLYEEEKCKNIKPSL